MNFSDQFCNLELAKSLKELGVIQESLFYRFDMKNHQYIFCKHYEQYSPHVNLDIREGYSAFTASELGELLPERIDKYRKCYIKYQKIKCEATQIYHYLCSLVEDGGYNMDIVEYECSDANEANSRAKMLVYLLQNGLIKNE